MLVCGCDASTPATAHPDAPPAGEQGNSPPAPTPTPGQASLPAKATPPSAAKTPGALVTASALADPLTARVGGSFTIRVDARIESGWHIYAIDRPTGPSIPTAINFELPKGLTWDGDWTGPEPTLDEAHAQEPAFVYQGTVSFSRRVRVARDSKPGTVSLNGSFHYQACDRFSCRAPTQFALKTELTIDP